jgi:hypothetical protein
MAFLRYAFPVSVRIIDGNKWERIRVSNRKSVFSEDLTKQATRVLNSKFNPKDYLLSHCTIVSSVDAYKPKNVKLGSIVEDGKKINRLYDEYRIKPECDRFVNDNNDAWRRPVLLKSYHTFIGADNFCEHVQIKEQSKGKVIDAIPRDIGPSVYIDLLVATSRDFGDLIRGIESGEINSLSMGCIIEESTCTKCGNVAYDESNMCSCVRYEKGNYFYDELGRKNRIAELCGNESLGGSAGVVFNDASWVGTPAFKGAVIRNIISTEDADRDIIRVASEILSQPPKEWLSGGMSRLAAEDEAADKEETEEVSKPTEEETSDEEPLDEESVDDESVDDESVDSESTEEDEEVDDSVDSLFPPGDGLFDGLDDEKPEDDKGLSSVIDEATSKAKEELKNSIKDELSGRIEDDIKNEMGIGEGEYSGEYNPEDQTSQDENLIRTAKHEQRMKLARFIYEDDDKFIKKIAEIDKKDGNEVNEEIYMTVLESGGTKKYGSLGDYICVCEMILSGSGYCYGEEDINRNRRELVRLGKLL